MEVFDPRRPPAASVAQESVGAEGELLDLADRRSRRAARTLGGAIARHNGARIEDYPDDRWTLVPFPSAKGQPFNADNLATVNDHSFLQDPRFVRTRAAAESRWPDGNRDISWRLHVTLWAVDLALRLRPSCDLLEVGVGSGYMAAGICDWFGFDLDEGSAQGRCPERFTLINRFTNPEGHFFYAEGDQEVRQYFSRFSQVQVIKGDLPAALDDVRLSSVGFLHVDLNSAEAEAATLHRAEESLVSPCVVLFDDSGNPFCADQLEVHRRFAARWGAALLQLPTGQALCVR